MDMKTFSFMCDDQATQILKIYTDYTLVPPHKLWDDSPHLMAWTSNGSIRVYQYSTRNATHKSVR